jgi:hypothetical protein
LEKEAQDLFHLGMVHKLTANGVLEHGFNKGPSFDAGFLFIVELKFKLQFLTFHDPMQTGNCKSQSPFGNVVDMNDTAANAALAGDFIGAGQADPLAVMAAKIKLEIEYLLAAATDRDGVAAVLKGVGGDMLDDSTGGAGQGCRVVVTDMHFNVGHCVQS